MALTIHFQGGPRAGETLRFADEVERIVIGRDPEKCQVVFPAAETRVGREHCALRRELARYRLVLNRDDLVLLDGRPAIDGQELGPSADLQLGRGGPKVVVETALGGDLPPTARAGHQRGQVSMLVDAERSSRRGGLIAFSAVLLVLVAGLLSYRWWRDLRPKVVEIDERQQKQQAELASHQTELTSQKAALSTLNDKLTAVDQAAKADEGRLRKALSRSAKSVYLVLERDPLGDLEAVATAWVVDQERGIVATNGHVAEIFNEIAADRPKHQLIIRSNDDPPRDFVIRSVQIHPGYAASSELWSKFQPARRTSEEHGRRINQPGPFCDVALMFVVDREGLASPLPLADNDALGKLGAGYPIGAVGYPMEGLSLEGVNVTKPVPTTHLAYITAVTDYFGSGTADAEKLLVQHAIPSAGGASGSPVINAEGQVVAVHNAGNVIGQADSARISSGALINFAQRADLVGELLGGHTDEIQAARSREWEELIARYYARAIAVQRGIHGGKVDELRSQWERQLAASAVVDQVSELVNQPGQLADAVSPDGTFQSSQTFEVAKGGKLLVVVAGDADDAIDISLFSIVKVVGREKSWPGSTFDKKGWLKQCFISLDAGGQFEVVVSGPKAGAGYVLHVFRARVRTPETRREALAANWISSHLLWKVLGCRAEVLAKTTVILADADGARGAFRASAPVELALGDDYFVVAAARGGEHITLSVLRNVADLVGEDRRDTDLASVAFSVSAAAKVQLVVTGPRAGVEVDIFVYRAVDPQPPK